MQALLINKTFNCGNGDKTTNAFRSPTRIAFAEVSYAVQIRFSWPPLPGEGSVVARARMWVVCVFNLFDLFVWSSRNV